MSIVFLKRDWFDPEGKLWSARNNPHEMDEELISQLPSDATVDGVAVSKKGEKLSKDEKVSATETKESGEAALAEKEREKKVLDEAEAKANDVKHAAVVHKTATPPKL